MSVIEKDIKKYLSDVGENLICSKEQRMPYSVTLRLL